MIAYPEKGKSVQVSRWFMSHEFDCRCEDPLCTVTLICGELLTKLDEIRTLLAEPIVITSGFRCGPRNLSEGGKPHSFHVYGMAVDVMPVRPASLPYFIEEAERLFMDHGIGYYANRLHLDMGTTRRWGNKNE